MQYEIKAIDPDSINKYPKGRTFEVCPLTPLVRIRLFNFFKTVLTEIPEEAMIAFKKKNYDILNLTVLITEIYGYLEEAGKLESFIAIVIRDVGMSDNDKDIDGIVKYLRLNCKIADEVAIFANFIKIIDAEGTLDILQSMKLNLMKSLSDIKPES